MHFQAWPISIRRAWCSFRLGTSFETVSGSQASSVQLSSAGRLTPRLEKRTEDSRLGTGHRELTSVSSYTINAVRFQTVSAALLLVSLAGHDSFAQQPSPSNPFTLQAVLAAAEQNNRTLIAARLGRAADLAGIDVAKQRPNPEASFEAGRDTPHEAFSVGVPLEIGGKRARRIDLANATLARTTADIAVQALDVRRAVRVAYFELVAAAGRLQVTTDLRGFAERTRNAARDRFESGAAPRLEALQAELALAQADNEQEAARGRLEAARAELNTLIGRPPEAPGDPTDSFDGGALPADIAAAVAASPDIVAIDRQIDEAVARERLAQTLRTPDTTVSGGMLFDSQPDFTYGWKAGVAITLPIFTRHTADVHVESAKVVQLRAEREARITELTGQATA